MNNALSEIDGNMIATSVATREKALRILKATRRPSLAPTLLAVVVVGIGLSGLQLSFWPKLVIFVACALSFASVAFTWRIQRQLSAAIDLLLLNEDQKR
jgi:hypothetical protein